MNKQAIWAAAALLALAAATIWIWLSATEKQQQRQLHALQQLAAEHGLAPLAPPPPQDPALVALGEALFFETALSGNRDVSCATCHHPTLGLGDGLALSIGTGGSGLGPQRAPDPRRPLVARNAIALFNVGAAEWQSFFWDGRVEEIDGDFRTPAGERLPDGLHSLLAAQAMFPVTFRDEMRGGWYDVAGYSLQPGATPADDAYGATGGWHDVDIFGNPNELAAIANGAGHMPRIWEALMARLLTQADYAALFAAAYPGVAPQEFGFEHAANALAAFQTEAFAVVNTPWDRFLRGDPAALPPEAVAGALHFIGQAGCARCHSGPLLSDGQYHNIGAPQLGPGTDEDAPLDYGRWRVTGDRHDRFAFRTPPLRNVTLTGPWLHNGAYDSLEAVVRHHLAPEKALQAYDGAHLPPHLQATVQNAPVTLDTILETLDPLLHEERRLTNRQVQEILAFLQAQSTSLYTPSEHH